MLSNQILRKNYKLAQGPEIAEVSSHFCLKESKFKHKIIYRNDTLYLSMPLSNVASNTLSAIRTNNYIVEDLIGKLANRK